MAKIGDFQSDIFREQITIWLIFEKTFASDYLIEWFIESFKKLSKITTESRKDKHTHTL